MRLRSRLDLVRSQGLVSHYLRTLRVLDLVRSRRNDKLVMYALTGGGRALLAAVLGARAERLIGA